MRAAVESPRGDAEFLDHLAHWVANIHAASALLDRLGFPVTPYAEHVHASGKTSVPAGSANQCVMIPCVPFMAGYAIECENLGNTRAVLGASGVESIGHDKRVLSVPAQPALGGIIAFTEGDAPPPWLKERVTRPRL